ncbi:MAG: hypothetical protein H7831_07735 [Magnetococcus sp. WYHC-3]
MDITPPRPGRARLSRALMLSYVGLLALFIAMTPYFVLLLYREADLTLTLLPELVGFGLQGGFLVLIFVMFEQRSAMRARADQKMALRLFLGALVQRALGKLGPLAAADLLPIPGAFGDDLDHILREGLPPGQRSGFRERAAAEWHALVALTAVAAQIDFRHVQIWTDLAEDLRQIRESADDTALDQATIRLLARIRQFDQLTLP